MSTVSLSISLWLALALACPHAVAAAPAAPATAPGEGARAPAESVPTVASAADRDGTGRRGGWLELKYSLPLGGGGWYGGGTAGPRLVGGYRFGRVLLGLELGASYSQTDSLAQTASGPTSRWMTVLAQPVIQVILMSGRLWELFGQGGAGVVYSLAKLPDSGYRSEALGLVAHVAAGARVFVHPRLGLGVELGVTSLYSRGSDQAPGTTEGHTRSASVNLYAALGLAVRL